jgi:hypothetical protein
MLVETIIFDQKQLVVGAEALAKNRLVAFEYHVDVALVELIGFLGQFSLKNTN